MEFDFESGTDLGRDGAGKDGRPSVHSVSALTRQIRSLLEAGIGEVWVEGEISNLRSQASGHHYFTLKDADAQLSCVLFRGHARFLREPLRDGARVHAFGTVSVYEARGQYQLVVRLVQPAGEGALQARFEALKRRLDAEGLFATGNKHPLPRFPATLGVVTSPTGAALRDILHVLGRRAPWVRVVIAPARVQGNGAAAEIVRALELLDNAGSPGSPLPAVDVIIAGRGGGSIEDLWPFNEEAVARAVYACRTPVVSAVGHEIDFTIADFVADVRAPTPSAAAELAVPDREELRDWLAHRGESMRRRARTAVDHWLHILNLSGTAGITRAATRSVSERSQSLDFHASAMATANRVHLHSAHAALTSARGTVEALHPRRQLQAKLDALAVTGARLARAASGTIRELRDRHSRAAALVRSLGPGAVFARGYSMTLAADGSPLTDASTVKPGAPITTKLAQGTLTSTVDSTTGE